MSTVTDGNMRAKMLAVIALVALVGCAESLNAFANGMASPARKDKMTAWLGANAGSMATCLHGSASSTGRYDVQNEDYANNNVKIRVLLVMSGDGDHPTATASVIYDSGNFDPDSACMYLHGVVM